MHVTLVWCGAALRRCAGPQVINEAIVKGPLLDICNDCSDKNIKGVDHKKTLEICDKWKYKISRDCGHDSFEQKTFFRTGHKCIGWIHYTVQRFLLSEMMCICAVGYVPVCLCIWR